MPGDALLAWQAIGEDVRPGAVDLMVDFLLAHPFVAVGNGLDQHREKRPHLEAVAELQRLLAAVGRRERDTDLFAFGFDRSDQLWRNVMSVGIDRHLLIS